MDVPVGLSPGGRFDEWARPAVSYCAADVDGTLVGRDNLPSRAVLAAVAALQDAGIPVGVATGRMRLSAEPVARAVGAVGPHILHNGAEVRSNGHRLAAWPLTVEHIEAIVAIGHDLGAYAEIYVDDGFYVTARDERARPHWALLGHEPLGVLGDVGIPADGALKATFAVFDDPVLTAAVHDAVATSGMRAGPAHSPITPGIDYVNTTHPDSDKGVALAAAARHLDTDSAGTAAIGDASNDIPMLLAAGTAIAMGDAPAAVQAAAHLVAPGVTDDGAAVAMQALLSS